ncbi:response regulator [bacterium]|nr:response regulator [bacterium]
MNKPKILIIDDDEKIRRSIGRHLTREGYDFEEAENGKQGLEIVTRFNPEVILLDVMMPVMNGHETCQILRREYNYLVFYIIMLSAKAKHEDRALGLNIGADEYITKPFEVNDLLDKIKLGLHFCQIKKMVNIDPLTGVYNRSFFNDYISQELVRCNRYLGNLTMMLLEINDFQQSATSGTGQENNKVIVEMAHLLKQQIRQSDFLIRWGEKLFVIVLSATEIEGSQVLADKLLKAFSTYTKTRSGRLAINIGVAEVRCDENDLFRRVEEALNMARNKGNNQVVFN